MNTKPPGAATPEAQKHYTSILTSRIVSKFEKISGSVLGITIE
jgi:hypothetical protein